MAEVTELKPSKTPNDGDSPAENGTDQTTPAPPTQKFPRGRPPNGARRPPEARQPAFFDKVASVPKEDWGTRAFMYVYVDEPACNPKTFGESRYLLKSSAPILDLEGLKQDYGSFKGWMSLNLRKTGKDATDEVDRLNFEIYDPKHPPKIPRGSWANDARNKRWLDLLPPEAPPASAAASSLIEGARFYKEVRDEVKGEMRPDAPQRSSTSEILDTMIAAKELFAPAANTSTNAPADPFDTADKIMKMRQNDPMITLLLSRMDSQDKALEAARTREFELLKEKAAVAPVQPKGMVEQLKELASISDSLTPLKTLFGFGNGASEAPVRAGRTGALDVIQTLGTKFFESDLASGVGQWLGAMAQRSVQGNGNGVPVSMNPGTHLQPQNEQQQFTQFIEQTLNPALRRFYSQGLSGGDFAGWLYDAFPDRLQQLQNFTHPLAPGMKGAQVIVAAYKRTPEMWSLISALREGEPSFVQFVNEFCRWKPESSEQSDVIDAEIVHEGEDGEGEPERVS